jgi:hypothetical protein
MNVTHLIAAAAVLSATASAVAQTALVQTGDYLEPPQAVSTRTRAAVIAELHQARADGALHAADHNYPVPVLKAETGRKTREQVQAELVRYRAQHPYGGLDHDYSGGH